MCIGVDENNKAFCLFLSSVDTDNSVIQCCPISQIQNVRVFIEDRISITEESIIWASSELVWTANGTTHNLHIKSTAQGQRGSGVQVTRQCIPSSPFKEATIDKSQYETPIYRRITDPNDRKFVQQYTDDYLRNISHRRYFYTFQKHERCPSFSLPVVCIFEDSFCPKRFAPITSPPPVTTDIPPSFLTPCRETKLAAIKNGHT